MTLAEVVEAVYHVTDAEKAALLYTLYRTSSIALAPMSRAKVLLELKLGAVENDLNKTRSLFGAFGPTRHEPSDEEIHAYLITLSSEWQEELRELDS